jgi:hypothetical protein
MPQRALKHRRRKEYIFCVSESSVAKKEKSHREH